MAKNSQQTQKNTSTTTTDHHRNSTAATTKMKRTRKSVPRDSPRPPQRSSIYRGVTRLYNNYIITESYIQ